MEQKEFHFSCPYCGEPISMLLDLSVEDQTFIEDCEVCCRPIEIEYQLQNGEVVNVQAERIQ